MFKKKSVIVIAIMLIFFVFQRVETKTIDKEYRRFFRSGTHIDLSQDLELSKYVGDELLEVTIRYNMVRSRLEIDWLVDGKTVFNSSLPQGLAKKATYRFHRPITSSSRFGIRLTGPRGQIQLMEIVAKLETPTITKKPISTYVESVPGVADWVSVAEGWSIEPPNEIDNTAGIEIDGIMDDEVVIIAGPGIAIECVPGFDRWGRPDDQPGASMELSFVFEYSGSAEKELQKNHEQFKKGDPKALRAMSVIVKNLRGEEQFRWNLFEFGLVKIESGSQGRKRYTYRQTRKPDNYVGIQRNPGELPSEKSFNPSTDKLVEIKDVAISYVPVEVDEKNRTITMTFDYVEGGQMWLWVRGTAEGRQLKKEMSIIDWHPEKGEVGRVNYYNCFPIRYRQFAGFGQFDKAKERVVISYGHREEE